MYKEQNIHLLIYFLGWRGINNSIYVGMEASSKRFCFHFSFFISIILLLKLAFRDFVNLLNVVYLNSWNVKPINFILFLLCAYNRCKRKKKYGGNTPTGTVCENMHKKIKGNASNII